MVKHFFIIMIIWLTLMLGTTFSRGIEEDKIEAMIKINQARQVVSAMGVAGGSDAKFIVQSASYELDNFELKLKLAKSNKEVQEIMNQVEKKRKSYADSIKRLSKLHMDNIAINHLFG